jgi:predicted enzyme related to lactoylglutathione lyase
VTLRVGNITLDCDDVLKVARFWSAALDRPLDPGSDAGFASIGRGDPGRAVPAWFFEKVPELKAAKNRMHLDFVDSDLAAVARLASLGASVVAEHELSPGGQRWTVMGDPEGNEFCVASSSFTG